MRVVITGGAGFIGSHLCDALLGDGHEVICIDNLLTGSSDNIAHIRSQKFTFVHYDVTNYLYIEGPVDLVLHFARARALERMRRYDEAARAYEHVAGSASVLAEAAASLQPPVTTCHPPRRCAV